MLQIIWHGTSTYVSVHLILVLIAFYAYFFAQNHSLYMQAQLLKGATGLNFVLVLHLCPFLQMQIGEVY